MLAYTRLQTSSLAQPHRPSRQSAPTSPVELNSGAIGWTHKLENPTLVWLTSFPHTVDSLPSSNTPLVLVSRSFADLRNAQCKLRCPGKDSDFDQKYGISLHCARARILIQNLRCLEQKSKWWSSCRPNGPAIRRVTNKTEARNLDDESNQRIANAFAHLSMTSFPPSLAQDLQFNVFYKPCDSLHSTTSTTSVASPSTNNGDESPQFPLVFRALVPSDGWRGLSPHPADEHNVHVLELTQSVIEDLTRFWFTTWDLEDWPEEGDFYGGVLKRTKSWSSRFEVDDDDVQTRGLRRADTGTTQGNNMGRTRGRDVGMLVCRAFRRLERKVVEGFPSGKRLGGGIFERFAVG